MEPDKHTPEQILDPSTIENLETARAALRWALERLTKAEGSVEDLTRRLGEEAGARGKALDDHAALQRTLALRSTEADHRELYYAKLEEFLSLKLDGKVDLAALAKREVESARLQEILQQKQVHLEKDFALRRAGMERDYQALKEELQEDVRARGRALEQQSEAKRAALEREHLGRMADAHEKEARVKQERASLEERKAHFQEYYEARHAELQSQLANFRGEIEDQSRFRVETAERMLGERLESAESVWLQEKSLLTQELESWRRRAREAAPRVAELERALAEAEAAQQQQRAGHDRLTIVIESERAAWKSERESLSIEAASWRERAVNQVNEILSLKEAAATADEEARHARAQTEQQRALYEQAKSALESERASAQEAGRALAVCEETLSHARAQKAALEAELAESRTKTRECLPRLAELEKSLAASEETESAVARTLGRLEEERRAWQREREIISTELVSERAKAADQVVKLLELEKRLAAAEETERRIEGAGQRLAARFDEQRKDWDCEREELKAQVSLLKAQLGALRPRPQP